MSTTRTLTLKFSGEDGKSKTVNVTDYKESLTDTEIRTAMDAVIDAGVLTRSGIRFAQASGATKTVTTKEEISFS